ncbi:hypothetical protein FRACYDRAFT_181450 [Fragilariopsis cylindrus CCMP1102]|uniref:Ubiquitin-like domain-containing protein n=1 Tax=Fragilariopsis cylindrus CCMP1102 TaxID=635003 RepID=A0A1E7FTW3_9STRA|nr:hypothetical protein FRACYDRAFT_181450 [Fragilariopsis cylindrus CCMP1102]|eukprot:OEU21547.1 hypothetical protein FRACYDRAFT_181450 [Fragilariopsis cylindrus CCMP1102]
MARLVGRRRNYTSVATTNNNNQDDDDDAGGVVDDDHINSNDEFQDEPDNTTTGGVVAAVPDENCTGDKKEVETTEEKVGEKDEITTLTVTILDSSHKKFVIPCNASWTIGKFKLQSSLIHQVPPKQQRLIYHGKMLTNDSQTLLENKINSSDIIIHLFPKPRVVVTSNNSKDTGGGNTNGGGSDNNNNNSNDNDNDDDGPSGAHIPSIIINQEEQDRRGQILVLGSVEIAESQNNVKMLSLLLVMICSMRLLALFSIAMGAGTSSILLGEDNDESGIDDNNDNDNTSPHDYNDQVRPWESSDYYDLVVSGCGFYVGMLGLKATQENTLQLATMYAIGTIISGILWNIWNIFEYIHFFEKQTEYRNDYDHDNHNDDNNYNNKNGSNYPNDELPPLSRDDFVTVAFFTILMPLSVWILCCIRAFEFRRLISEAEEEATERIRNEYNTSTETEQTTDTDNENNSITEMV